MNINLHRILFLTISQISLLSSAHAVPKAPPSPIPVYESNAFGESPLASHLTPFAISTSDALVGAVHVWGDPSVLTGETAGGVEMKASAAGAGYALLAGPSGTGFDIPINLVGAYKLVAMGTSDTGVIGTLTLGVNDPSASGTGLGSFAFVGPGQTNWTYEVGVPPFHPPVTSVSARMSFISGTLSGAGLRIVNVTFVPGVVSAVPEPAAALMFFSGLAGLGLAARRIACPRDMLAPP